MSSSESNKPASGVDAVAVIEQISPSTFYRQKEVGDLHGWCERTREALRSALSPTATSESEAGVESLPVVAMLYIARGGATARVVSGLENGSDEYSELVRLADVRALAKPASSPAGGDVREAFETCAAICEARAEYFDRAPSYREWTDAARSYRATAKEIRERAALSPATSTAEPMKK